MDARLKEATMRRQIGCGLLAALCALGTVALASAQDKTVMVGGAAMYPSKNIIDNAMNSQAHTTLVAAVKAAGLVETLKGPGPFTVFAPTNEAFAKLPAGTVDVLLEPANKGKLTTILTYHVVAGRMDAATLMTKARANGGKLELSTVSGGKLWVLLNGETLWLQDEKGAKAAISIPDVYQSNGVIHVIDAVVMPR
jgi:uncharacterized surface protein with fasciclin (FAS1) repeats